MRSNGLTYSKLVSHSSRYFWCPHCEMILLVKITPQKEAARRPKVFQVLNQILPYTTLLAQGSGVYFIICQIFIYQITVSQSLQNN